ncbi:uncharacterized protein LOC107001160 [Solanum pennellii]|uniref:Uncharacterized protein LOC107001160 n=1 Tax=Solanum pennellii TaxID=28526 RepID=A0ABM1FCB1_SOLPN|nr:uncharacterized protein LOC107001160 [Solanum pennellii]
MNNQHQICVDEDAMLMDDLEHKVGGQDATLMEVPIPLLESQETKTDVVENVDKQRKDGDDKDAILMEVSTYFMTHDESIADVLEYQVDGDEDTLLMDVPISFIALEKANTDIFKDMNNQHQICADEDAMLMDDLEDKVGGQDSTLMEVPIPLLESQETKYDVVENMDKQRKDGDDKDAILMEVPTYFMTHDESIADVLERMDRHHEIARRNAIMAIPISSIAPQGGVSLKMDKHHKGDRIDAIMTVPLSSIAPQTGFSLNMDKQNQVDGDEAATLMDISISFIALEKASIKFSQNMDKQYQVDGDEDATLIDVPISFIALKKANTDIVQNEIVPKNMHYMHTHTFEQRRQNWIINNISRPSGLIIDYVYLHLETKKKFRSLIEVYKFVVYGEVPEIAKKSRENEETFQATPRRKQLVRGTKLIKNYVVGTCTKSYDGVYIKNRGEAKYLSQRDIPSNIEKKRKRGNEDLYGHQQVKLGDDAILVNSGDATLSPPIQSFLYLWDFELVPEAHNENIS